MRIPLPLSSCFLIVLFVCVSPALQAALTDIYWQSDSDQRWNYGPNWNPTHAPNNTELAILDATFTPNISSVHLNTNASIGGLSIASGYTLTRDSSDTNNRSVFLDAATDADTSFQVASGGAITSGGNGGSLTLEFHPLGNGNYFNAGVLEASNGSALYLESRNNNGPTLTNSGTLRTAGTGILGFGTDNRNFAIVGGSIQNTSGTLTTGDSAGVVTFTDVTLTNDATFQLSRTGSQQSTGQAKGISLEGSTTLTNSGNFYITDSNANFTADGPRGVSLNLNDSTVGFTNSASGVIHLSSTDTTAFAMAGAQISFLDNFTLTNNGSILMSATGDSGKVNVQIATDITATLAGSGELFMQVGTGASLNQVLFNSGNDGTLINGPSHTLRGAATFTNGHLINQGTLLADNATYGIEIDLRSNDHGVLNNSGTLRANGAAGINLLEADQVINTGTLQIDSGSQLTVADVNTFTSSGTLILNGTVTSTPDLTLSGGTLTGAGSYTGNLLITGNSTFAPITLSGDSLTVTGNLTFSAAALNHQVLIDQTSSSLTLLGNLNIGSGNTFEFTFNSLGGFLTDTPYTLFDITGSNNIDLSSLSLSPESLAAGFELDTSFGTGGWNLNASNLEVQFRAIPVPEPAVSLLLLGGAILGVSLKIRYRSSV